jgi:GNAT superfamily N-acetyltransferase
MELQDIAGVSVLFADLEEALDTDWRAYRDRADLVRVTEPPTDSRRQLTAAGFHIKPDRVTWMAPTGRNQDEFLSRLTKRARQNIRTARHHAAADGLALQAEPLSTQLLDAFLPLYLDRVAEMRHGLPAAARQRDIILAEGERWVAVCAYDGSRQMVGACLCYECHKEDVLRIRYSAVDPRRRESSLARVLYAEAASLARDRGFGRISLGNDPNLYGHIAERGLFEFKVRMGFEAVPSRSVDPVDGEDVADLVLRLSGLSDPAFLLSYAPQEADRRFNAEVFTAEDDDVDLRSLQVPFIKAVTVHHL